MNRNEFSQLYTDKKILNIVIIFFRNPTWKALINQPHTRQILSIEQLCSVSATNIFFPEDSLKIVSDL